MVPVHFTTSFSVTTFGLLYQGEATVNHLPAAILLLKHLFISLVLHTATIKLSSTDLVPLSQVSTAPPNMKKNSTHQLLYTAVLNQPG